MVTVVGVSVAASDETYKLPPVATEILVIDMRGVITAPLPPPPITVTVGVTE